MASEEIQTACKPGSVLALRPGAAIPLGRALPRASRDQPGLQGGNAPGRGVFTPGPPPLRGLAPGGVYPAAPVARGAVRSCRTVSPLPWPMVSHGCGAVCFLWHFPWGRPRRPLTGTVFPWSPDFPPSRVAAEQRLPGRLDAVSCSGAGMGSSGIDSSAPCVAALL